MDLDTRIFLAVNGFAHATPWLHSLVTWTRWPTTGAFSVALTAAPSTKR